MPTAPEAPSAMAEHPQESVSHVEEFDTGDIAYGYRPERCDSDIPDTAEGIGAQGSIEAELDFDYISSHNQIELEKRIRAARKDERGLLREIAKIERKQKKASYDENLHLIVRKIGLTKEICEISIDSLSFSVYAGAKKQIAKCRRWLIGNVNLYNSYVEEYERVSGKPLTHLSRSMADDIAEGRTPPPIQTVYFVHDEVHETEFESSPDSVDFDRDRLDFLAFHDEEEKKRRKSELDAERKRSAEERKKRRESAKEFAEKISATKRHSERDLFLIKARYEHDIAALEAERALKINTFTVKGEKKSKDIREIERTIRRLNRNRKRAIKLEAADNSRYYQLKTLDLEKEKLPKRARRERLDSLRMRLDVLLSERENINDRLLSLYGGSEESGKRPTLGKDRKVGKIKKRYARYMYKRQRALARRVSRMHVPLDLKEKIFDLMNKKTESVTVIESTRYKLLSQRPKGAAKREMKRTIREAKRSIRLIDADIKFLVKRAEKHDMIYHEDVKWIYWLITIALVIGAGIAVWYFAGDAIWQYFSGLFGK